MLRLGLLVLCKPYRSSTHTMATETEAPESVTESGPSTAVNVTRAMQSAYLQGQKDMAQAGARPAAYSPRLKTESLVRPPLMYQSTNVSKLEQFEEHGAAVAPAITALDALHAALVSVIDARAKSERDPTLGSEAAAVLKVAAFTDKVSEAATRKLDAAAAHIQTAIKDTKAQLSQAVSAGVHTALATEIRSHCKAEKSPMAFITQLINSGDAASVGAILAAPPYLSGITQQMREALTQQWNAKQNPALTQRLALLEATAERLDRAGSNFILTVEKAMGVRYDTIKRLRDAQTAASF